MITTANSKGHPHYFALMQSNTIRKVFEILADTKTNDNPIKAIFEGFLAAKSIIQFIEKSTENSIKINYKKEDLDNFKNLLDSLIDILFFKSLGLLDFSQDVYEKVIQQKRDSKKFTNIFSKLRNNSRAHDLIFNSYTIFKNVDTILEKIKLGINPTKIKVEIIYTKIKVEIIYTKINILIIFTKTESKFIKKAGKLSRLINSALKELKNSPHLGFKDKPNEEIPNVSQLGWLWEPQKYKTTKEITQH